MFNFMLRNMFENKLLLGMALGKTRGRVLFLLLSPEKTEFNVNDFKVQSKKSRRSEKIEDKDKNLLQYSLLGKCISLKFRGLDSAFTIRNVMDLCPFEFRFNFFNPLISSYVVRDFFKPKKKYSRAQHYEYRKIPPHKCAVSFTYVLEEFDDIEHYRDVLRIKKLKF